MNKSKKIPSFTMAEILLSLTIIGVVAAITLPALTGNINERTWETQKKALYARMSQAIALMGNANGYGTYNATVNSNSVTTTADTAAAAFITDGLSKVFKINNICTDTNHFADCGFADKLTKIGGGKMDFPKDLHEFNVGFAETTSSTRTEGNETVTVVYDRTPDPVNTKAAAFETQNGESIILYYNPRCISEASGTEPDNTFPKMCANFLYDLNGKKGPNAYGKDIGAITVLYPTDSVVVAPEIFTKFANTSSVTDSDAKGTWTQAVAACEAITEGARLPNKDEAAALFLNAGFTKRRMGGWTSVLEGTDKAYVQRTSQAVRVAAPLTESNPYHCIKR